MVVASHGNGAKNHWPNQWETGRNHCHGSLRQLFNTSIFAVSKCPQIHASIYIMPVYIYIYNYINI